MELNPGDLVGVLGSSLVQRYGTEEEHYTARLQLAIFIGRSHRWREVGYLGEVRGDVLLLFSNDARMYLVPDHRVVGAEHVKDPSRIFGRLPG